jgi:hypothetical protein
MGCGVFKNGAGLDTALDREFAGLSAYADTSAAIAATFKPPFVVR